MGGEERREEEEEEEGEEEEEDLFFMWRVEELLGEVCMSGRRTKIRQRAFGQGNWVRASFLF